MRAIHPSTTMSGVEGSPGSPGTDRARRAGTRDPHPNVAPPPERPGGDEPSSLADGYRKAEPYLAASSTLVASVIGFTALGWWLDQRMGHSVHWLLLVGAGIGMAVGFVSFFRKVLRTGGSR